MYYVHDNVEYNDDICQLISSLLSCEPISSKRLYNSPELIKCPYGKSPSIIMELNNLTDLTYFKEHSCLYQISTFINMTHKFY